MVAANGEDGEGSAERCLLLMIVMLCAVRKDATCEGQSRPLSKAESRSVGPEHTLCAGGRCGTTRGSRQPAKNPLQ